MKAQHVILLGSIIVLAGLYLSMTQVITPSQDTLTREDRAIPWTDPKKVRTVPVREPCLLIELNPDPLPPEMLPCLFRPRGQ